ncbi:MAG TPA: hypothetical protein VN495_02545 [Candidatus Paceibacterota bacterium]|nr:hypothetical protein [Candidatus Paceibacterota bacterium]
MKHIAVHLSRNMQKRRETERGELMRSFLQRLNLDRAQDGYPPLTMPRLGHMLAKIPTKDLYYLKRVCEDAGHFSKKFWWELNPKKHDNDATAAKSKKKKTD